MVLRHKQEDEVIGAPRRWLPPRSERMQLTDRDRAVVRWVFEAQVSTREQLQRLFFTAAGRSLAQRRLTLLYRNRYLDKLARRPVNAPDIYYVSRRASRGLRLLRQWDMAEIAQPRSIPSAKVDHTVALVDCRIAFVQAARMMGYTLPVWFREDQLVGRMEAHGIIPDAYFQLVRTGTEGERKSSFFLEVERSAKSDKALEQKFRRYGDLYYGGAYEAQFGARALRVLALFGSDYGINPQRQIARCLAIARRLDVTMLRFATLEAFLSVPPERLLTQRIWYQPKDEGLSALFL